MTSDPPTSNEVLVERIDNLVRAVDNMQRTLTDQASKLVPRTEWLLRNDQVDREFKSKGAEIAELRTEVRSTRLPWTTVVTAIASIAALLFSTDVL